MTFLSRLYPGDAFCLIALSALVQITLITTLAFFASRTLAHRNAALRHCILLSALLWVPLTPLAASRISRANLLTIDPSTWLHPNPHTQVANPRLTDQNTDAPPPQIARTPAPDRHPPTLSPVTASVPIPPFPAPTPQAPTITLAISAALIIWCAIWLVLMIRFVVALYRVSQLRRHAQPATVELENSLQQVLPTLHRPEILISNRIPGPVTIGIRRPAILLPSALLHDISPDQLRDVLIHECVHAARHDYAVGILQRLVGAALWFHPMIHLLNRELRRAREEVCDNAVLQGRSPAAYSRTLLDLCQRIQSTSTPTLLPGFFDAAWPLEHRVNGILNQRRIVMTHVNKTTRFAVAFAILMVGLTLSAIRVSRAQSAIGAQPDLTRPSTMPAKNSAVRTDDADDPLASMDQTKFISLAEQTVRNEIETANRAIHRAELGLREAEIKVKIQQLNLQLKQQGVKKGIVDNPELEQAQLDVQMAGVQLERARVGLEEAKALQPVRRIRLTASDLQRAANIEYPVQGRVPTLIEFITQHFPEAMHRKWQIELVRTNPDQIHIVIVKTWDLESSDFGQETLQAGDVVSLRRDIAGVANRAGKILWRGPVHGKDFNLRELLEQAGFLADPQAATPLYLTGPHASSRQNLMPKTLADVARGGGKNLIIEPGDIIIVEQ